jgi:hypothetical protein
MESAAHHFKAFLPLQNCFPAADLLAKKAEKSLLITRRKQ